jgi:fucokinase
MGDLTRISSDSRQRYAELVTGARGAGRWWTAVVVTASSRHQAERYEAEIRRRREEGKLPQGARFLVSPDWQDRRMGSGGATLHALRALAADRADAREWWRTQRVLMIHSGGDSRRLPQYSLSGKLFSALPVRTPWGEASTVFDETMALSAGWVEQMSAGLAVCSGDVVLTFDAAELDWDRPGVCGVAMRQPPAVGSQHGVYVTGEAGRVYGFLQKPSLAQVQAAGGLLEGGQVALDTGLLRFDAAVAARLAELAAEVTDPSAPRVDLYEHFTMALTGQWAPGDGDHPFLGRLAGALRGTPFWCSLVTGEFTHVGSTALFRRLLTEETEFSRLYAAQQRLGTGVQAGVRSAGVVLDSAIENADVGAGAVVIETNLAAGLNVARGALVHGLEGIAQAVEVPEDTVVHQVPVALADGTRGVVIRVYHVADDAKATGEAATWLGHALEQTIADLGLDRAAVWPGTAPHERSLWNAKLFPVSTAEEAWACARWMLGLGTGFTTARWRELPRLSLGEIVPHVDAAELEAARARRRRVNWERTAVALADSGADIRPLVAHAPEIGAMSAVGRRLDARANHLAALSPTEAASRLYQASLFYAQAGLEQEAADRRRAAFEMVTQAVERGVPPEATRTAGFKCNRVDVQAPARIDFGGGWSDTPPFCLDWGGTVLNAAIEIDGALPIRAVARRIDSPLARMVCEAGQRTYDATQTSAPGDPFAIHRAALELTGVGAGVEIRTEVNLPMGSGLGTSSILAAALLRALNQLRGVELGGQQLSDQVMRLEQSMTTGGGWQDQAGGIFPGLKLVSSGPGLVQRLRAEPVAWSAARKTEFETLAVLYNTGIRRIAKDLLRQVVGSYLARETRTIEVLHSIKTLAMEMAYAMREGGWDHLGWLLNRHWELNQALDPHTTNAPINALLEAARPYIRGAKLAGAGGGGFLILLAKDQERAGQLREVLARQGGAEAKVCRWRIAEEGMLVTTGTD